MTNVFCGIYRGFWFKGSVVAP